MLIMTSIIRVGQSKFVTVPIDEDSNERIMNCIQTLSELKGEASIHEVFLDDTKAAYTKMLGAQEVCVHRRTEK
jgi:coatomer subunit beta